MLKRCLSSLLVLLTLLGCRTTSNRSASTAVVDLNSLQWTSEGGNVLFNGKVFHIKGVNWFGLETLGAKPLGLNQRSVGSLLDWLKTEDFNALRIPISVEWALDPAKVPPDQVYQPEDADLVGKPWVEVLAKLVNEAAQRGIVVMLDMHTINAGDNLTTKRWYNERFGICDFRRAWQNTLDRFGDRWNVFAIDLKNELQDVDWGNSALEEMPPVICQGPDQTEGKRSLKDWKQEVESLVGELDVPRVGINGATFIYRGLYVVQGMHHGRIGTQAFPYDIARPFGFWLGGNLEGVRHYPLELKPELAKRIAYTTHVYGPSVYPQPYFDELNAYANPENMDVLYESQNGFVERITDRALIIGEWGGLDAMLSGQTDAAKNGKDDGAILGAIASWFPKHCVADAFWWAINPESSDTGGLLEGDYQKPIDHKLAKVRAMQAKPSQLAVSAQGEISWLRPGEFHPDCLAYMKAKAGSGDERPSRSQCLEINQDGTTCAEVNLSRGESNCTWGQQWRCENGCAVWLGPCD